VPQGFIQLYPDGNATGKQLDSDVVQLPAGTIITNLDGTTTTLTAPAYYYRERVVNADPVDPLGLATVTNDRGPDYNDYGLTVRMPGSQPDMQTMIALLMDMAGNLATLAGTQPLGFAFPSPQADRSYPQVGSLDAAIMTPGMPRPNVSDIFGRQLFIPHTIRDLVVSAALTITASTTETTLIPASGDPNVANDLVGIVGINTSATATEVDIRDQLSTVTTPASQNGLIPLYFPAGDMRGFTFGGVLAKQTNPNQAWTATGITSVSSVKLWALYIKNRVR